MKSALYVFEGPDDVGKTTLASALSTHLNESGFKTELLSFPGRERGTLGEHVYRLYHEPKSFGIEKISIIPEQLLFAAAHAEVIETRVLPSLAEGSNVVLDRYWWSTWVYATAGGLSPSIRDLLIDLEHAIWRAIKPTCIFLVHRDRPFGSEHGSEQWQKLVELYEDIKSQELQQARVVDIPNDGTLQDTMSLVCQST